MARPRHRGSLARQEITRRRIRLPAPAISTVFETPGSLSHARYNDVARALLYSSEAIPFGCCRVLENRPRMNSWTAPGWIARLFGTFGGARDRKQHGNYAGPHRRNH